MKKKVKVCVNSNFHRLSKKSVFDDRTENRFTEYRQKWEKYPQDFFVADFPLFLDVEVTSICNLKCHFCATTFRGDKIEKGFMSFDMLKRIIDECDGNDLYGVKFNIRGEPLLHPMISDFVKYAKSKGLIDVYFNTNGMLLNEEVSMKLIDAGLDRLSVSFEGFTKEVYERHRSGSNYERVVSNIETIQKLKKKTGVLHPKIRIQSVMLPELELDKERYRRFWSGKVDEVAFLDYKEMKNKKKNIQYPWACPQLWQRMAIWWDGTILPCNHDDDALIALGNLDSLSIKDAWHSEMLSRIRSLHAKGVAHKISACNGCYLRDSEIAKIVKSPVFSNSV